METRPLLRNIPASSRKQPCDPCHRREFIGVRKADFSQRIGCGSLHCKLDLFQLQARWNFTADIGKPRQSRNSPCDATKSRWVEKWETKRYKTQSCWSQNPLYFILRYTLEYISIPCLPGVLYSTVSTYRRHCANLDKAEVTEEHSTNTQCISLPEQKTSAYDNSCEAQNFILLTQVHCVFKSTFSYHNQQFFWQSGLKLKIISTCDFDYISAAFMSVFVVVKLQHSRRATVFSHLVAPT